ncbi:MAG: hypothetical protein JEZ11_04950 [Desulfobacterales bacterium]|nr:hypothetical protein [Desulfobacterales bacterium]
MASFKNSFKAFVVATALGIGTMAVVVVYNNPAHNAGAGGSARSGHAMDRIIQSNVSFALVPGQAGAVGSIQIVFRNLERPHHLLMDVTIPDLDPFYVYPYAVDITSAKNGFTMAGQRFRLLAVNRSRIWLKWLGPALG